MKKYKWFSLPGITWWIFCAFMGAYAGSYFNEETFSPVETVKTVEQPPPPELIVGYSVIGKNGEVP